MVETILGRFLHNFEEAWNYSAALQGNLEMRPSTRLCVGELKLLSAGHLHMVVMSHLNEFRSDPAAELATIT